eukprot:8024729-Lingulodinium_polyedra.AAC.1
MCSAAASRRSIDCIPAAMRSMLRCDVVALRIARVRALCVGANWRRRVMCASARSSQRGSVAA